MIVKMKVLIIGHPGSGKTYMASALSVKTGLQVIDIDVLFDKHPFYMMSKSLYTRALHRLIKDKDAWIIDGYHVNRMPDEIIKAANLVIYLNLPAQELKQNIISRYREKKRNKERSHGQSMYFNNLKNFGQIKFQDKTLRQEAAKLKNELPPGAQFVELNSRDDMKRFLDEFNFDLSAASEPQYQ